MPVVTGVYICLVIFAQSRDCDYMLEQPPKKKYHNFSSIKLSFEDTNVAFYCIGLLM